MVIIWLPEARQHLKDIYQFYKSNRSVSAAIKVRDELYKAVTPLTEYPKMAPVEVFSTKVSEEYHSLVVGKYFKIVYYISNEKVYISSIFDCRQDPKSNENKLK